MVGGAAIATQHVMHKITVTPELLSRMKYVLYFNGCHRCKLKEHR